MRHDKLIIMSHSILVNKADELQFHAAAVAAMLAHGHGSSRENTLIIFEVRALLAVRHACRQHRMVHE